MGANHDGLGCEISSYFEVDSQLTKLICCHNVLDTTNISKPQNGSEEDLNKSPVITFKAYKSFYIRNLFMVGTTPNHLNINMIYHDTLLHRHFYKHSLEKIIFISIILKS